MPWRLWACGQREALAIKSTACPVDRNGVWERYS
jgi:hypothetical protein